MDTQTLNDFKFHNNIEQFYSVEAVFYKWKKRNYRSVAYIKSLNKIDGKKLVVIMLNPGSCIEEKGTKAKPIKSHSELLFKKAKSAKSDPTQRQIMELMIRCNITHSTIINLYDLMEGDSKKFIAMLLKKDDPNYEKEFEKSSIFSFERMNELNKHINKDTPVLLAWGGLKRKAVMDQKEKAKKIIEGISKKTFSINENLETCPHPCPRIYNKKKEWIIRACEEFNKLN